MTMKQLVAAFCLSLVIGSSREEPIALFDRQVAPAVRDLPSHRIRRASETERDCSLETPYYPETTVNTTQQLLDIRNVMENYGFDAYIVPSEDAHGSEYIAAPDKRRQFISGFSGSAGIAIITANSANLWTDGRYFLQAQRELDCSWAIMESGEPGVPTTSEWLVSTSQNLAKGAGLPEGAQIGFDPTLLSISSVQNYESEIEKSKRNLTLNANINNLVDEIWENQPTYPDVGLSVLELKYTGQTWQDKITNIRSQMQSNDTTADKLIVTKLDEIAWLFNLRGKDIPYNPMFISYAIVGLQDVKLYVYDKVGRVDNDDDVKDHLDLEHCSGVCVEVLDYDQFDTDLPALATGESVIWFSDVCSYFIYQSIPQENQLIQASPILLTKAQKNQVETEGMRKAHLYDSISLCELGAWMQETMDSLENPEEGDINVFSEMIVQRKAEDLRRSHTSFRGLSFGTISSFGANGAVIHYSSSNETDVPITNQGIFLLDSGGQYLEGTCDITRSFHFGEPTNFMKEAYTRVLMGHIDLVTTIYRTGVYGREIDIRARLPLFQAGLDYRHGTGHGIGHFLNVHEGPGRINLGYSPEHEPIHLNMFFSDEPGYYEDGEFGIRIENVMYAVEAKTEEKFNDYTYMTFKMVSLVPFEPVLIDFTLLSSEQIEWYNAYNQEIRDTISDNLSEEGRKWMESKTQPYDPDGGAAGVHVMSFTLVMTSLSAILLQ